MGTVGTVGTVGVTTEVAYTVLVALVACERVAELAVTRRNAAWSFARGGVEYGRRHYPWMVTLHSGFLLACVAEVWLGHRPFVPALGVAMLVLVLASQALRWWCIASLGHQWNTRVIVVPGRSLVARGPYRLLRHPNYVAVAVELAALPLVHTAWVTAVAVTLLNAPLLAIRIRTENRALAALTPVGAV